MLNERYPFISLVCHAGVEYVGIIQNRDNDVTTIYDFDSIRDDVSKTRFLDMAAIWWWESNHSIPINIFLRGEWDQFRDYLKTFTNRDLEILHGPTCSLKSISRRKAKRRSITLLRGVQ
jgi:hypothetical protein